MKSRVLLPKILFACAAGCLLTACGGGDDNNSDPQPNPSPTANQYVGRWASECVTLGSVPGGPDQAGPIELRMSASRTTLPQNISAVPSSIGGPYTAQVTVEAITRNGNRYVPANGGEDFFSCNIIQGIESVRLYYHDGADEHYHEEEVINPVTGQPTKVKVEYAYRAIVGGANSGAFTFYVHADSRAGTAVVRCSAQNPQSGKLASTEMTFTVGGNSALSGLYAAAVKQVQQGQAAARSMRYEMELAQHGSGKNLLAREERIELFADANCKQSMLSDEGKTGAVLTWQYEQPVTLNGRQVQADTYLVGGNYQRWLYKEGETLWGRAAELDALGLNFVAFHRK